YQAVKKFCLFADEILPKLRNKQYSDYQLKEDEWKLLSLIKEVLAKLRKWYKTIDESDTYFICLALHPSIKLEYCMDKWDKSYYDAGYSALEHVVCVLLINEHINTDF
ncbi:hypothetical protein BYT27DRAFT_7107854, partial [Phlegmacium glaucopus]